MGRYQPECVLCLLPSLPFPSSFEPATAATANRLLPRKMSLGRGEGIFRHQASGQELRYREVSVLTLYTLQTNLLPAYIQSSLALHRSGCKPVSLFSFVENENRSSQWLLGPSFPEPKILKPKTKNVSVKVTVNTLSSFVVSSTEKTVQPKHHISCSLKKLGLLGAVESEL